MGKQKLNRIPEIKDFTGMNIINSLVYCKEMLKRETDEATRETLKKRLSELMLELKNYKRI